MKKAFFKIKINHSELAKELGVSVYTVYGYKATSPKKLALMLDGMKWRKYVKQHMQEEAENAKKAGK
ncbi:MAG: helix-turn-helix domain-containing protein [Campylobacteraceae bacterium]|nr:helix-turn-helix domain-containing protein [Campylobacteraceae bacterium]